MIGNEMQLTDNSKQFMTLDNQKVSMKDLGVNLVRLYEPVMPADSKINLMAETDKFLQIVTTVETTTHKPMIESCNAESIRTAYRDFVKSKLSLIDGQCFLFRFGANLTFLQGSKGKAQQAKASVDELDRISAIVVYNGEEISSHIENGVEIFDHKRDFDKKSNEIGDIKGVYTYAYFKDGTIKESKWKSLNDLIRDWCANKGKLEAKPSKENGWKGLSANHIHRASDMAIKTGEASIAEIVKKKYANNDETKGYLDNIIAEAGYNEPVEPAKKQAKVVDSKVVETANYTEGGEF